MSAAAVNAFWRFIQGFLAGRGMVFASVFDAGRRKITIGSRVLKTLASETLGKFLIGEKFVPIVFV